MASPFFLSKIFLSCVVSIGLCACAPGQDLDPSDGIHDPGEARNRKVHEFNRNLDRAIVRRAASGYTAILPDEVEDSVGNFATNLSRPSQMVNATLQGDVKGLGLSTSRFLINSVLGIGGLFDVASDFGIKDHDTDFGETLHVWGVGEGRYVELPILGPSTSRDAVGIAVDLFTNPLSYKLDAPESYVGTAASAASGLGQRGRYSDTIDSILYESADSYAQARLIYLQNRRHQLGQSDETSQIDPFELDTEGF
jgi:phospholipid-binding lipoprotein MlaA